MHVACFFGVVGVFYSMCNYFFQSGILSELVTLGRNPTVSIVPILLLFCIVCEFQLTECLDTINMEILQWVLGGQYCVNSGRDSFCFCVWMAYE